LNLLIYEHITAGGYRCKKTSSSILSEGYGMLRTLTSDFQTAGHHMTILLDSKLVPLNQSLDADKIIITSHKGELEKTLTSLSKSVDAVYVIAPESNKILQRLVECVETAGGVSLNCAATAIEKVSNKHTLYNELKRIGIRVPETLMIDSCEEVKKIKQTVSELGFPLIFKPIDGVGCQGLSIVKNERRIKEALGKLMEESFGNYFLAQKFINGTASSVSLISTGKKASPLTLNEQIVTLSPPNSSSAYTGGTVPFHHPLLKKALETAQKTVELFKGLEGYVGVDMVLTKDEPVVMEVNPRLTTSYIGLRKVINFNVAQAIVNAVLKHEVPENVQSSGYAFFSKVTVPTVPNKILPKICKSEEIISPPFSIEGDETAYALLIAHSAKLKSAKTKLYEATKRLINMLQED
jgi:predicted ATP-grasp superfamily ATP-dependent carboligase